MRTLSGVAPGVAAWLAERLFVTPPASRRPDREARWATQARQQILHSDAGDLATWSWGEGPRTVLLVHGWAGRGLQLGAFARPLVERGCRVITFDAPGHGESPGLRSSLVQIAGAAAAVARAEGGVDAIVAHSLGATACVVAAGRGERIAGRLAALAPSSDLAAIVERFGVMTGFTPTVLDRMRRRIGHRLGFDWAASEPLAIAPRMRLPLLVAHDLDDRFVPFSEGEALATAWPAAQLITTSALGHHRLLRDPAVVDRVADFITSARASADAGLDHRLTA